MATLELSHQEAAVALPQVVAWCSRTHEWTTLRQASWSLRPICIEGKSRCPYYAGCKFVAREMNRPEH